MIRAFLMDETPVLNRRCFLRESGIGAAGLVLGLDWAGAAESTTRLDGDRLVILASDHRTVTSALAAMEGGPAILKLDSLAALVVDATTTLPATVEVVARGGLIALGDYDLRVEGRLIAPLTTQVFHIGGGGRVAFGRPITVSPQNFGAVADGVTRCDAAIRATQHSIGMSGGVIAWPTGSYLSATSLFLYGRVSWIAGVTHGPEILLGGFDARPGANFLAVGVSETVKSGLRWSGVCRGLRFRPGPEYRGTSRVNIVNVFDAQDYEFSENLFEGFTGKETAFKGANDSKWVDGGTNNRARGRYLNNTINFDQGTNGGESISVAGLAPNNPNGKYASDITIQGNTVTGGGDDAIAIHGGERITIAGNTCRTLEGRVLVRDTEHFTITDNQIEHTGAHGGVALIDLGFESRLADLARSPSHGLIARNRLRVKKGQQVPQAMFIRGAHDVIIETNEIANESDNITRIRLLGDLHLGTLRSYGRITIRDNRILGGALDATGGKDHQDDWVVFGRNTIDGAGKFEMLIRCIRNLPGTSLYLSGIANVLPSASSIARVRAFVADAVSLRTWAHADLPSGGTTVLAFESGLTEVPLSGQAGFLAVEARILVSRAVQGDVNLEIMEDGVPKHVLRIRAGDGTRMSTYVDIADAELSRKQFGRGTRVGVRVVDPTGNAAGRAVEVEVIGVHMNALAST